MHKIKAFREVALATIPLFVLTACSKEDMEKTELSNSYHSIFVDDNGETLDSLKISDLRTVGVYVVFEKTDNGVVYSTRCLQYKKFDGYTLYFDAIDGDIYSYSIDTPTTYDQIYYGSNGHKDMYYIENLATEVYDYKSCGYIKADTIDLENDTVDPFTVKLMYADYIPHNQRLVKSAYYSYIQK